MSRGKVSVLALALAGALSLTAVSMPAAFAGYRRKRGALDGVSWV